jgi:hypothetical protein
LWRSSHSRIFPEAFRKIGASDAHMDDPHKGSKKGACRGNVGGGATG